MKPSRWFTTILFPLFFAAAAHAGEETPTKAGTVTLKQVTAAFQAADHKKVIELVAQVPADAPEAPKFRYLAGESLLVLGRPADAEAELRAVLATRPKAVPALVALGRALSLVGNHDEAVETLRRATTEDAKDVPARRALGEALLLAGQTEEGTKVLEAALAAAPNDPATVRAFVEARIRAEDLPGALAAAEKLAKAQPKHPIGKFLVAVVLDRQDKDEEAIAAYEKALLLDPAFLDAHKNLAILCHVKSNTYQDQARVKKAFAHYEKYFELGGSDARLKQMYDTMKAYFEEAKKGNR
jgi:tetratricopeptide (TPR) repeat protein